MDGVPYSLAARSMAARAHRVAEDTAAPDAPKGAVTLDDTVPSVIEYHTLQCKNPKYNGAYCEVLRSLTTGGEELLNDASIMDRVFPRHNREKDEVYAERKSRALYIPYPGEIVGEIVSLLANDPLRFSTEEGSPAPDKFYSDVFFKNVDGAGLDMTGLAQHIAREALVCRHVWVLCDLPPQDPSVMHRASLLDQEQGGDMRSTVTPICSENVIDWMHGDDGELLWALVLSSTTKRLSPASGRRVIVERYTFYTRDEWVLFEVAYDPAAKEGRWKKPEPEDKITQLDRGPHSFGSVPLLCFSLPHGLWALDKIASIAIAHFNQRSGLSWNQFKHFFPLLAAFLGPENGVGGSVPSEAQQNPNRATDQVYGPGFVNKFGNQDDLRYVSPDSGIVTVGLEDLRSLRDEMHRVTHTMALTLDNTPAAVGRSGESKMQDQVAREIVAKHIGQLLVDFIKKVVALTHRGRKEQPVDWKVEGFSAFDLVSPTDDAPDAIQLVVQIGAHSKTFSRLFLSSYLKSKVRRVATTQELKDIDNELATNLPEKPPEPVPPKLPTPPGAKPAAPPTPPKGP